VAEFNQIAIFDLDGTLVDSVQQIAESLNRARIDFGYSPNPLIYYQELIGLPIYELLSDIEISRDVMSDLIVHFRDCLVQDIRNGNNIVFPGVISLLELFVDKGIGLAIATSKPTRLAIEVVRYSLLNRFKFDVQGTDDFPPKPNPEVISRIMNRLPLIPAFMVGDRKEDILAAKNAGIPGIGIAASAHSLEQLKAEGASLTFSSFNDFFKSVEKDFGQIQELSS
jgi:phosphoglycolate phosphatase